MNLIHSKKITMSTREIAELLKKNHSDIKRSARRLSDAHILTQPLAESAFIHNGNEYTEYLLEKRDCLVLVAQNSPEFTAAIVDRWQELESGVTALPDFTNPVEAARAWADAKESEQKALAVIEANKPKIAVYEQLADRKSDISTTLMAKQLECCRSAIQLNKWMREQGIKMQAIDAPKAGYGDCFNVISDIRNGHEFTQCLITPEGQIKIAEKWAKSIGGDV